MARDNTKTVFDLPVVSWDGCDTKRFPLSLIHPFALVRPIDDVAIQDILASMSAHGVQDTLVR